MRTPESNAIAIVGMACIYPDAANPRELWENVMAQRRSFRRFPPQRLRLADYPASERADADAIYISDGAFIQNYQFDREAFRISGATYRSADLTHWLALDVAGRALSDAGFPGGEGLPRESSGVLLGNSLTGEFSRAALMRLRWPYVQRHLAARLGAEAGWDAPKINQFLQSLELAYKEPFPAVDSETLAGGLSNTIAGRICNYFNLQGGGYTVDGACSSSLLAVANACAALNQGDLDLALAGGVDLSLDPFELIGFSKTGALAHAEMRVYDRRGSGFLPGEGCGFVVLMRHADALAQGLHCYALIRGWGVSSDGGGGLTRPEALGQGLALRRAYARAGFGADSVALFEGHGTGTVIGDETELRALADTRRQANSGAFPAVVGSIKANIGHTKAAAGIAGLIKAATALHRQILPPHAACEQPHPILADPESRLRRLEQAESWPAELPLRAGVSSFGFGGINAHIALEGAAALRREALTEAEITLSASAQDVELFLFSAADASALLAELTQLAETAAQLAQAELADLSAALCLTPESGPLRAACLAANPQQLHAQLQTLCDWLRQGEHRRLDTEQGLFLALTDTAPRIAFLFPGQAAPVRLHGGAHARRFPAIAEFYRSMEWPTAAADSTARAQPAIIAAELAGIRLMRYFGLNAVCAAGHSLGELAALHWAGALPETEVLNLARLRGEVMHATPAAGAMASLSVDAAAAQSLLAQGGDAVIAAYNAPAQTVISGPVAGVERIIALAHAQGHGAQRLPVGGAFHSPLMQAAARTFSDTLSHTRFSHLLAPVVSTVTGRTLDADADLAALLTRQITEPVRFSQAFQQLAAAADLLIEVGPGHILAHLTAVNGGAIPALPLDVGGDSLRPLFNALAAAYVRGAPLRRAALCAGRFHRALPPAAERRFFANPCESAPRPGAEIPVSPPPAAASQCLAAEPPPEFQAGVAADSASSLLELTRRKVAERAELPLTAVSDQHRLLQDLHLNSITVGQLVVELCQQLRLPPPLAPTEYAAATVAGIADALADLQAHGAPAPLAAVAPGVDAWVRAFSWRLDANPPPAVQPKPVPAGEWRIVASPEHPLAAEIALLLPNLPGKGVLFCLPPELEALPEADLLAAARAAVELEPPACFAIVQHHGIAAAFARTVHAEYPRLNVCLIDVPPLPAAARWAADEIARAQDWVEVYYDASGVRQEPRLELILAADDSAAPPALTPADVLMVSGGGKGIAAECALALNRRHGVRLILLGRAHPEQDVELAANLQRFAAHGAVFRYHAVDVTDADGVAQAVAASVAEWGPVTAILHGAGLNRPCGLSALTAEACAETLAPKIQGFKNLLAAVNAEDLKLVMTFGSVIGRIGMRGEADYALANAWLTRLTEDFQRRHPASRCLALEWSIWSGVGMGERLGRVDALLREGVTPISPDQGVAWLLNLLRAPRPPVAVIISGRIGKTPALPLPGAALPFLRFLEQTQVYYPGIELVVDSELSPHSDPYLLDHVYQGELLLPAVIGLEAMAQAAQALAGQNQPPIFERIEFLRPVVVPRRQTLTLRLAVLRREDGALEIVLRCGQTGFQTDHFRAVAVFAAPDAPDLTQTEPAARALALDVTTELYDSGILFHHGRFRRLQAYFELDAYRCQATISPCAAPWFAAFLPQDCVLGDPAMRDAAIHAIQACIPHARLLPAGMERWLPINPLAAGPRRLAARERESDGEFFVYDVALYDQHGELTEYWQGLRLKRIEPINSAPWSETLLIPYLQRKLDEFFPSAAMRIALRDEMPAELVPARGATAPILHRPDGKPELLNDASLSASHAGGVTLQLFGQGALACDWQAAEPRAAEVWSGLLGAERHALAELLAAKLGESLDVAATRVWCAMECLKKAALPANTPLTLRAEPGEQWLLLAAGAYTIASFAAPLRDAAYPRALGVLLPNPDQGAIQDIEHGSYA